MAKGISEFQRSVLTNVAEGKPLDDKGTTRIALGTLTARGMLSMNFQTLSGYAITKTGRNALQKEQSK